MVAGAAASSLTPTPESISPQSRMESLSASTKAKKGALQSGREDSELRTRGPGPVPARCSPPCDPEQVTRAEPQVEKEMQVIVPSLPTPGLF